MIVPTRSEEPPGEPATFLEDGQLAEGKAHPVPRAILSPRARVALWGLRVFVVIVSATVIYTFVSQVVH